MFRFERALYESPDRRAVITRATWEDTVPLEADLAGRLVEHALDQQSAGPSRFERRGGPRLERLGGELVAVGLEAGDAEEEVAWADPPAVVGEARDLGVAAGKLGLDRRPGDQVAQLHAGILGLAQAVAAAMASDF